MQAPIGGKRNTFSLHSPGAAEALENRPSEFQKRVTFDQASASSNSPTNDSDISEYNCSYDFSSKSHFPAPPIAGDTYSENTAARALYIDTGVHCRKWAPPGAGFEYRYQRIQALLLLAETTDEKIANALYNELAIGDRSEILWGPIHQIDIRRATMIANNNLSPGRHYLRHLCPTESENTEWHAPS